MNQLLHMLEKNPDDAFLNYAAALEFKKNHQLDKAIDLLEKLIGKNQNYLAAYYQLGKLYEMISEGTKAVQIYGQGITIARAQNELKTVAEIQEALEALR